jgi:hypothetical protein
LPHFSLPELYIAAFTLGRIHPVSLWVAVAMLVWSNLRAMVVGPSETWHKFAEWLIH